MSDIVIVENINVIELTVVDNNTSYDFSINEIVESIEFTVVEVFGKNGDKGEKGDKGDKGEDGLNGIQSIQAGDNITIDNTDPLNPIISAEEGGTIVTKTSDLTNDGEDGTNPFITVLDIPTIDLSPYALLTDLAAEASTRLANDTAETTARQNADNAESNARTFADGVLDGKITTEKNRNDTQDSAIADLNVHNITITTSTSITTNTLSTINSFNQNGRNVILSNGVNAINLTCEITSDSKFVASYTKLGSAAITFTAGSGATLVLVDGTAILNGAVGSTACLTRSGNTFYLQISNR